ncbi:MAG TPA: bifunctional glutamate--cysteine ligase GshA/glutathione synthetase GshB, partial [Prolixibacteraceae bacterium]|nr:bifunctional glutamate--cysteine ligase GshA/glutathione synthetase GshB [Prolixibacteraceae bacterium]
KSNSIKGNQWITGLFGLEKENIRADKHGTIALTPHPASFGDKLKHPYITTDFSESQIEMITPPMPSISEALGFLETIHDLVSLELSDEYLWPQSIPPVLPSEKQIPVASYDNLGKNEEEYRKKLASKYGKKKQTLSGIHFNFSLDENLLRQLHQEHSPNDRYENFVDSVYLKITRQLLRYRWLYILLFGCTPVADPTFELKCRGLPIFLDPTVRGLSFRTSCFGYGNIEELFPDYHTVESYKKSIEEMVQQGKLSATKELYAPVRPKLLGNSSSISYVEIRFIDINPLNKVGLSPEMLRFLHALAIYGLLSEEPDDFGPENQAIANQNHEKISMSGIHPSVDIISGKGQKTNNWSEAQKILHEMKELFSRYEINNDDYSSMFRFADDLIDHPEKRAVIQMLDEMDEKGFINFHLEKAQKYLEDSRKNRFNFKGLEDMELSTQLVLREAVRRGVSFELLDRKENFIGLSRDGNIQYLQQATKTSLDNYVSILAMENKIVTKKILKKNGIRVPNGMDYSKREEAKTDFFRFKNQATVIKPKTTNFGKGITILKENGDRQVFERAVDIAFEADNSILVEEFIPGKEFRFFVMNNEVAGILHRVPANVTGNGQSTIRKLVEEKNLDPLRGNGYRTPLEKIKLGEAEKIFLASQGKTFDTIPAENERVFLRENSNISTGGDSIDVTDEIPDSYKALAVKAAQALDVKITGLDMIIRDDTQEASKDNYAIIEMNFNPAIHIHCHPHRGQNRRLNEKLLDLLGYPILVTPIANYNPISK